MGVDLTIGMAVYDDFRGVLYTIQALKMYHPDVINRCELLVVNNNPLSEQGKRISQYVTSVGVDVSAAEKVAPGNVSYLTDWKRYQFGKVNCYDRGDKVGTAFPRNLVFELAQGKIVLCMDSHVLLPSGAIEGLLKFYDENPDFMGLVQGPMLYDQLATHAGSFTDTWGAEMHGQWQPEVLARDPNGAPFEIQAMGLGLFACRKDAWIGFNPMFEGFGGEEWYIHTKFRRHGQKCLNLPKLRWWHDFSDIGKRPYPLKRSHKLRNELIGHLENEQPIDRVKFHFVNEVGMSEVEFNMILDEVRKGIGSNIGPHFDLQHEYEKQCRIPSDINEHLPTLRQLASECSHVTEFGVRTGVSTTALLAGLADRPETTLRCYDINSSPDVDRLRGVAGQCRLIFAKADVLDIEIEPTEMLFVDTLHTGEQVALELFLHADKVSKYLVFHDTEIFGEQGEGGKPGLWYGIRWFLSTHRDWKAVRNDKNNNGLLVLQKESPGVQLVTISTPTGGLIGPVPRKGPGTELKSLLSSVGVEPKEGCSCRALMNQMNIHGVAGCKRQRNTLIGMLKDNSESYGFGDILNAAWWSLKTGLAWKINPLDPVTSLFDEALRRAEEKGIK